MISIKTLESLDNTKAIIAESKAILLYFKTNSCDVGEAVFPKVQKLMANAFPKIKMFVIDMNASPVMAAHYLALVEPTILIFFEGKEYIRRSRNISISELSIAL